MSDDCVEIVAQKGLLLYKERIQHSYPCDWRTKQPIITILSEQWFIDVAKIVPEAVEALDEVTFIPRRNKDYFVKLLKERTSWCISRQRHWGVPLPVFYDQSNHVVFNRDILNHVLQTFRSQGVDSWWELPADHFLPAPYRNTGLAKGFISTPDLSSL